MNRVPPPSDRLPNQPLACSTPSRSAQLSLAPLSGSHVVAPLSPHSGTPLSPGCLTGPADPSDSDSALEPDSALKCKADSFIRYCSEPGGSPLAGYLCPAQLLCLLSPLPCKSLCSSNLLLSKPRFLLPAGLCQGCSWGATPPTPPHPPRVHLATSGAFWRML